MNYLEYVLDRVDSGPIYKHAERDYSMFYLTAFSDCHLKANIAECGNGALTVAFMVYKDLISRYYRLQQDNEKMLINVADNIYQHPSSKNEFFEIYSQAAEKMLEIYSLIESQDEFNSAFTPELADTINKLITGHLTIMHRSDSFVKQFEKTPGVADEMLALRQKYELVHGRFETEFELLCRKAIQKYPRATLLDLKHMTWQEFSKFLDTGKIPKELITQRQKLTVVSYLPSLKILVGDEAEKLFGAIQSNEQKYSPVQTETKEINGKTVYGTGKITGKCQLITDYDEVESLIPGKILVTPSTLPKYNHVYARAQAIVTDEGSILAHASIFCREYKIPGIIGTKIATSAIHDDAELELDLEKGTVKIRK